MSKEKKGLTKSAIREPKKAQKLEFCQSQRSRFDPIETAPIQMDRSDAEGVKDGDADTGKNQVLSFFGYIPKQLQKLVLGERESFRNSSILSDFILLILGHLRLMNYGVLGAAENPIFEVVWV